MQSLMQSQRALAGQCSLVRSNAVASVSASPHPRRNAHSRRRICSEQAHDANAACISDCTQAVESSLPRVVPTHQDPQACSSSGCTSPSPASASASFVALALRRGASSIKQVQRAWRRYQQQLGNSALGGPLLAMGMMMPVMPGPDPLTDMLTNRVLMTAFWAWFMAQFGKIFTKRFKKGVWDIRAVIEPGGMPSSHSSLCSGVTTAIALSQGFGSPVFAVALAFSVIVMYDAMGVRRHAGKQAEVLNQVIEELMEDHPIIGETKLKEVLGHTPRQVLAGALLGVAVGVFYPSVAAAYMV